MLPSHCCVWNPFRSAQGFCWGRAGVILGLFLRRSGAATGGSSHIWQQPAASSSQQHDKKQTQTQRHINAKTQTNGSKQTSDQATDQTNSTIWSRSGLALKRPRVALECMRVVLECPGLVLGLADTPRCSQIVPDAPR